jgi:hypothetical protein
MKTKIMKTTIRIALIAICYFAINFTANAQSGKVLRPRTTAATIPAQKPTPAPVDQTVITQVKAVDASLFQALPKQDPQYAQITGTITVDSGVDIKLFPVPGNGGKNNYYFGAQIVHPVVNNNAGGLVGYDYEDGMYLNMLGTTSELFKKYKCVITKIDDTRYTYTIYNAPTNSKFALTFLHTYYDVNSYTNSSLNNCVISGAKLRGNGLVYFYEREINTTGHPSAVVTQNVTITKIISPN